MAVVKSRKFPTKGNVAQHVKILLIYCLPGHWLMSLEVAMLLLCESPTCIYVILGCHSVAGRVLKGNGYGRDLTSCFLLKLYRPFQVGVASRLATAIHVAMLTPIIYDNSYSLNESNLKYESYRPYD